ncbi:rhomboid-like protein [Mycobacterium sp.]|uniref:rhomboid-like protein n=1 Tax=Mycobacterium sp. TaxID=1785 RepID=UPI002D1FAE11|nr:rhomboid-like protein [Mycobacterium sp.]
MLSRILPAVTRLRVTVSYALMLVAVATTLLVLGPRVRDVVIRHMSTNLHNLWHGHIVTLIGSAFVTENGPMWFWLPGLVALLAVGELLWRSGRVFVTFALGHVGATLIVAVGLTAAIRFGWLPISVEHASDVGISYGAEAVLGALTAAVPAKWRPAWIGWWLVVGLVVVVLTDDFTNAGHFVALVLGMLLSTRFRTTVRWTRIRIALLGLGGSFGYLMLVNTAVTAVAAPLAGAVGALAAHWAFRRYRVRRLRRSIAIAPALIPEPALYD